MRTTIRISFLIALGTITMLATTSLGVAQTTPADIGSQASPTSRIQTLEQQADTINAQIFQLNREMEVLVENYNKTRIHLDELTMELADSHIRLDDMWARYTAEEKQLSDRVVSIYKAGEINVFEIIVNSEDFNEFYVQLGYMKKVNDQDNKLKEQYKHSAREISKLADEIDMKRLDQLALEKQLSTQKSEVEAMLAEREAMLGQVNAEVQQIIEEEAARQLQEQEMARAEAESLLRDLQISDEVQAQVVMDALQFLGVPYVWGGESPQGFDCSGLTKYVYARHGISLPHYAAYQYNMGVPVPNDMLQPGDLIFWGPGHPHHVGMYIGQGKYVEASGFSEMVKISTLTFDGDYAGARRFPLQARSSPVS